MTESNLTPPYGGELVDLVVPEARREEIERQSRDWPSWDLRPQQLCDLELLLNGAFSPLRGFMNREDYDRVCGEMRLESGTLWPLPITLDVSEEAAQDLSHSYWQRGQGAILVLRDPAGFTVAVLHVEEIWRPNRQKEARLTLGTAEEEHPWARHLLREAGPFCVGGWLEGVRLPVHYDFRLLRHTPRELRREFAKLGWRRVLAFQTRNPIHRSHHALTQRAARETEANLLVHPVVGMTKPGDVDYFTRVRTYQAILSRYPKYAVMLSLLPLAMRMAGPREALLHSIIRRNYGCSHIIIGRDHAGPGIDRNGEPLYEPFAAQVLARDHVEELGIEVVPVGEMVYVPDSDEYRYTDEVPAGEGVRISGAEVRRRLVRGAGIPPWMSFPEVVQELKRTYRPRHEQGFTVFLTGLPGAGKTTIAHVLMVRLMEMGGRPVTLLDGDIVRKNLSSELTFSKEHRDISVRRIGFVAAEITKNGGIAICSPIAPYAHVRNEVRRVIEEQGGFILIHVATPLEVCEVRDRKGAYAKAREGIIKGFTGISDAYDAPVDAEITIDTTHATPDQCAQLVLLYLEKEGFIMGALEHISKSPHQDDGTSDPATSRVGPETHAGLWQGEEGRTGHKP